MSSRLRFSARGTELPPATLAALVRLVAMQAGNDPEPAEAWIAVRARLATGHPDWDSAALQRLHRALDLWLASADDSWLASQDGQHLDDFAAELATALEAVANIGKTVGQHAARGE